MNTTTSPSLIIERAIAYQKTNDDLWNKDIAHKEEYQQIKENLIAQAKICTSYINADDKNADEHINLYARIIEVYREFYFY